MESLNEELARKTVNCFACSNCWGELELTPDLRENGMYFVVCRSCKDETRGYVTQYFVNRRRSDSEFEKRDVTILLRTLGILERPPRKSVEQNLKELGF